MGKKIKTGFVKSHFLDSGAFSLYRKSFVVKGQKLKTEDFFDSPEFWEYIDNYAAFIKKYKLAIDHYANLDVIGNPELTWRNQKYLEKKHKLNPVPIVHYLTDAKWLQMYIKKGYDLVGFGGLVGNTKKQSCIDWLNQCFDIVCNNKQRLPKVKVHGFGLMRASFLFKYPFWSVDATNAEKLARYGKIIVPRMTKSQYDYRKDSIIVALSERVTTHRFNINYRCISPLRREYVMKWLEHINDSGFFSKKLKFNTNAEYKAANYFYYMELLKRIPEWPWSFKIKLRETLL